MADASSKSKIEPVDFEYFANLVYDRSGIVLEPSKAYLIDARMTPVLKEEGMSGFSILVEKLRSEPHDSPLIKRVVDGMTTNETSFFRDLYPFELFKTRVIPELMERNKTSKRIAIWSGACSTGQEPYSLSLSISENFPELKSWDVTITATDLSERVLGRAASGSFSQLEVNRGLPVQMLSKYFEKDGLRWQVCDEVRQRIDFRQLNLLKPIDALPRFDVVFLRNVLIYFDLETKQAILGRIRGRLAPEGYLFLGAAESTLNVDESFVRMSGATGSCYQLP